MSVNSCIGSSNCLTFEDPAKKRKTHPLSSANFFVPPSEEGEGTVKKPVHFFSSDYTLPQEAQAVHQFAQLRIGGDRFSIGFKSNNEFIVRYLGADQEENNLVSLVIVHHSLVKRVPLNPPLTIGGVHYWEGTPSYFYFDRDFPQLTYSIDKGTECFKLNLEELYLTSYEECF